MVLASTSVAGVRFRASIREGRGLKRSAREAGVDKKVGYRWLRECYLSHRRNGVTAAATKALLGFVSVRMAGWEAEVGGSDRHHLRVDGGVELVFWNAYKSGLDLTAAAGVAGVSRSTAYRWLERRFSELRDTGVTLRNTRRLIRLTNQASARAEQGRRDRVAAERRAVLAARREALRSSRRFADRAAGLSRADGFGCGTPPCRQG